MDNNMTSSKISVTRVEVDKERLTIAQIRMEIKSTPLLLRAPLRILKKDLKNLSHSSKMKINSLL